MGIAYRTAKQAVGMALDRLERRPENALARLCYQSALEALERVEALEIAGQQNGARLAPDAAA